MNSLKKKLTKVEKKLKKKFFFSETIILKRYNCKYFYKDSEKYKR